LRKNLTTEYNSWVISTSPYLAGRRLKSNFQLRDFKLLPQCKRDLRFSGMLFGVESWLFIEFQDNLSVHFSRVEMKPIDCPEKSVRNCQYTPHNIAEERDLRCSPIQTEVFGTVIHSLRVNSGRILQIRPPPFPFIF
jgi:hypothetical protein